MLLPFFFAARHLQTIEARRRLCKAFWLTFFLFAWPWIGLCMNLEPFSWLLSQFAAFHAQPTFSGSALNLLYQSVPFPPRILFFLYWIITLVTDLYASIESMFMGIGRCLEFPSLACYRHRYPK
jgi:hypothetical protein